jgi:hypothetical protein
MKSEWHLLLESSVVVNALMLRCYSARETILIREDRTSISG